MNEPLSEKVIARNNFCLKYLEDSLSVAKIKIENLEALQKKNKVCLQKIRSDLIKLNLMKRKRKINNKNIRFAFKDNSILLSKLFKLTKLDFIHIILITINVLIILLIIHVTNDGIKKYINRLQTIDFVSHKVMLGYI